MADNAIRIHAVDSPDLHLKMRPRVIKRMDDLRGQLTSATDWADFRHRCGQLRGLTDALEIIEQVEKEMNG